MAAVVLGGVPVQLVLELDRAGWAMLLGAIALAAYAVARRRRRLHPGSERAPLSRTVPIAPQSLLCIVLAIATSAAAVAIASEGAREERRRSHFTALSALPQPASRGPGQRVALEVLNHEGAATAYRLRVTRGGEPLRSLPLILADGARWQRTLAAPRISQAEPLRIELLRDGRPYRSVVLRVGSSG